MLGLEERRTAAEVRALPFLLRASTQCRIRVTSPRARQASLKAVNVRICEWMKCGRRKSEHFSNSLYPPKKRKSNHQREQGHSELQTAVLCVIAEGGTGPRAASGLGENTTLCRQAPELAKLQTCVWLHISCLLLHIRFADYRLIFAGLRHGGSKLHGVGCAR